jgi:hypothetical protein
MRLWKLEGVGVAFALLYGFYTAMMAGVVSRLTGFRWSPSALKILGPAVLILGAIFGCTRFLPEVWALYIGSAATCAAGVASLLALQKLLGVNLWDTVLRKLNPPAA